jgi:glycosyltransferase involved in cell wall biosynthesis
MAVEGPVKIRMGVALDRYPPVERQSGSIIRMVTICELTFRRGVDLIIDAMPQVWEKESLAELHIIGTGEDISELQYQAKQADPPGSRIIFHGQVDFPYHGLREFDLFVLASRSDILPIELIEAMLAGLPIVATAVGGIPELLSESGSGRVVPVASTDELAKGIKEMLQLGRHGMEDLGRAGSRFVRENFSVEQALAQLDQIYEEAIDRRRARLA